MAFQSQQSISTFDISNFILKNCWQSPFSPQMVPPKMQLTQKLSSQETMITNPVLRVVDIPLTEASDSPKIAAWHMTPTEVRRHLLYNHTQVIQQEMKSDQRCKLYSIFCRKKPLDLLCCIFTGWLTLGDIRTESIFIRFGTKGTPFVIVL